MRCNLILFMVNWLSGCPWKLCKIEFKVADPNSSRCACQTIYQIEKVALAFNPTFKFKGIYTDVEVKMFLWNHFEIKDKLTYWWFEPSQVQCSTSDLRCKMLLICYQFAANSQVTLTPSYPVLSLSYWITLNTSFPNWYNCSLSNFLILDYTWIISSCDQFMLNLMNVILPISEYNIRCRPSSRAHAGGYQQLQES